MAKTIKFNLILDNKPVRTIEELQENFCIDDVLEFYQKGLLQKWLKVRGFEEYLKKVEAISNKESVINELIKIFGIEKSEKEIKEATYSLEFWQERKLELEKWNKKDIKIKQIIADYHNEYSVLKENIITNKEDMSFMKNAAKEIFDKYLELFKINFMDFFFEFYPEDSPLIIYAILMNLNLREYFLNDSFKDELQELMLEDLMDETDYVEEEEEISPLEQFLGKIQSRIQLHKYIGETDGYWKDLEIDKTKVMVLSIPEGTYVRSANKPKEELSSSDINGKFLVLDGLLYKSNNSDSPVVYMEV